MIDFIQYGALGIVAFTQIILLTKTNKAIENNTQALTQLIEKIKK